MWVAGHEFFSENFGSTRNCSVFSGDKIEKRERGARGGRSKQTRGARTLHANIRRDQAIILGEAPSSFCAGLAGYDSSSTATAERSVTKKGTVPREAVEN